MKIAFTYQEKLLRTEAERTLDDPKADHWHRTRAQGVLAKTQKAAEARRDARVPRGAEAQNPKPVEKNTPLRKAWECDRDYDERQRAEAFLASLGGSEVSPPEREAATDVAQKAAASGAPRADTPQPGKFCERCQVSFEICHCDKPKPTSAELVEVAALDTKNNVESADDLTPCPLCLIPRAQCHHSGRRNPTDQINFLQAQMMGQG